MTSKLTLLKVGGAELSPGPSLDLLVATAVNLAKHQALVIVHGGGAEISSWQQRLGIESRVIGGLRVTNAASLEVAEMVLSGLVNKRLVGRLVAAGIKACGFSGVDGGLFQASRLRSPAGDLGLVGEITAVNSELLLILLQAGYTPVISPISFGKDDLTLNVNADHAEFALARALQPESAIYLSNVAGVLCKDKLLPTLNTTSAVALIQDGTISGGMVPKVQAALETLETGADRVLITNLEGLASGAGTWVQKELSEEK